MSPDYTPETREVTCDRYDEILCRSLKRTLTQSEVGEYTEHGSYCLEPDRHIHTIADVLLE